MKEKIIKKLEDKFILILAIFIGVSLVSTLYVGIGYIIGALLAYSLYIYRDEKKFLKYNNSKSKFNIYSFDDDMYIESMYIPQIHVLSKNIKYKIIESKTTIKIELSYFNDIFSNELKKSDIVGYTNEKLIEQLKDDVIGHYDKGDDYYKLKNFCVSNLIEFSKINSI